MLAEVMNKIFGFPFTLATAVVLFSVALLFQIFICSKTKRILSRLFAIIISGFAIAAAQLIFSGTLELQGYTLEAAADMAVAISFAALPVIGGLVIGYIVYIAAALIILRKK